MGDTKTEAYEEDLLDYEDEEEKEPEGANKVNGEAVKKWVSYMVLAWKCSHVNFEVFWYMYMI